MEEKMKLKFAVILFAVFISGCSNNKDYKEAHFDFINTMAISIDNKAEIILMNLDGMIKYWNGIEEEDREYEIEQIIIEGYTNKINTDVQVYLSEADALLYSLLIDDSNRTQIHAVKEEYSENFRQFMAISIDLRNHRYILDQEMAQHIINYRHMFSMNHILIQEELQGYILHHQ